MSESDQGNKGGAGKSSGTEGKGRSPAGAKPQRRETAVQLSGMDGFQARLYGFFDWLALNRAYLLMVLGPVALIAFAGLGWQWFSDYRTNDRRHDLGLIDDTFAKEAEASGKQREALQKQIDALQAEIDLAGAAATKKPAAAKDAPAPVAQDPAKLVRKAQLEKERDDRKPDHTGSRDKFAAFFKSHSGTSEGWMAGMRAAGIYLEDRKVSDARPFVETIAKESLRHPWFQVQSRLILIGMHEDAGEFDAALKEVDVLIGLAPEDMKPKVMLAKGRIQLLKDARTDARNTLDDLIAKHGTTPEAQQARSFLALMN